MPVIEKLYVLFLNTKKMNDSESALRWNASALVSKPTSTNATSCMLWSYRRRKVTPIQASRPHTNLN